jgi:hypothetical protein
MKDKTNIKRYIELNAELDRLANDCIYFERKSNWVFWESDYIDEDDILNRESIYLLIRAHEVRRQIEKEFGLG